MKTKNLSSYDCFIGLQYQLDMTATQQRIGQQQLRPSAKHQRLTTNDWKYRDQCRIIIIGSNRRRCCDWIIYSIYKFQLQHSMSDLWRKFQIFKINNEKYFVSVANFFIFNEIQI